MITTEHTGWRIEEHADEDVAASQERLTGIRDTLARHGHSRMDRSSRRHY
ncbi:hypothetical protein [Streptomyces sp. NBC_01451]|nr:hypothetical protein [Streptomyces sp. NBC_01451]